MIKYSPDWVDPLGSKDLTYSSGTTSSGFPGKISLDVFLKSMKYLKNQTKLDPVLIQVWRGPKELRIFNFSQRPRLEWSNLLLKKDSFYIVAGIGVVAGTDAYEFLKRIGVILVWSDDFIPLEDQAAYRVLSLGRSSDK